MKIPKCYCVYRVTELSDPAVKILYNHFRKMSVSTNAEHIYIYIYPIYSIKYIHIFPKRHVPDVHRTVIHKS